MLSFKKIKIVKIIFMENYTSRKLNIDPIIYGQKSNFKMLLSNFQKYLKKEKS